MMSRCLHAPLVFLFAACQNQISLSLSLFSHFPSSACLCFPFPHLCLIYPFESSIPDSLFFFPFSSPSFSRFLSVTYKYSVSHRG